MINQSRQGDVLITRLDEELSIDTLQEIPADEQGRHIMAHGEATGHAHAFDSTQKVKAYFHPSANDRIYLRVIEPSTLTHHRHKPIQYLPGWYLVIRQRENFLGDSRAVID